MLCKKSPNYTGVSTRTQLKPHVGSTYQNLPKQVSPAKDRATNEITTKPKIRNRQRRRSNMIMVGYHYQPPHLNGPIRAEWAIYAILAICRIFRNRVDSRTKSMRNWQTMNQTKHGKRVPLEKHGQPWATIMPWNTPLLGTKNKSHWEM